MAKILWITVEGRGEQGTYTDEVFIVFENVFTTASLRIVIKHFPWTQTCLVRVSCRCATRQIFLISGCFDSVWVMGQCIEELIDNILLDDTPSVACFFLKVVKYQLRLNVRLPWCEFESSDCWDKTVRHLLCWRQVAHKITVNSTVSYENSERILKITIFICVLDMKTASLISPVRHPDRLEEVKSDMTFISTQERKTALFHAVEKGHVLIVKELLDAGANTETTNKVRG